MNVQSQDHNYIDCWMDSRLPSMMTKQNDHESSSLNQNDSRSHEYSMSSDHDDSSSHIATVNDSNGGNIIGVDNQTPPVTPIPLNLHDEATARNDNTRQKNSNNPFLTGDEELDPDSTSDFNNPQTNSSITITEDNIFNCSNAEQNNVSSDGEVDCADKDDKDDKESQETCELLRKMTIEPIDDSHASLHDIENIHGSPHLVEQICEPQACLESSLIEEQDALNRVQVNLESKPSSNIDEVDEQLNQSNAHSSVLQRNNVDLIQDSDPLPPGWEKVIDDTHGVFYIDHNTQRTQYERPYEIELYKGQMGFGFTLVEADNGLLLVRSVIPGGPAYRNGLMRPGDILVSAVGISVYGLQHTEVAKLFSAFAVGDTVKLTFARSNYTLDENLIPDEYLISNGAPSDMRLAINNVPQNYLPNMISTKDFNDDLINGYTMDQQFETLRICLRKGNQGFGFTLGDSTTGQRVKDIQNPSLCADLRKGDTLVRINDQEVSKMSHNDVVTLLKSCPIDDLIYLTIQRRIRIRSKTPIIAQSDASLRYLSYLEPRNCRTPTFDANIRDQAPISHMTIRPQILPPKPDNIYSGPSYNVEMDHNYQYLSLPEPVYNLNTQYDNIYHNQCQMTSYTPNGLEIDSIRGPPSMNASNAPMSLMSEPIGLAPQHMWQPPNSTGGINQLNQYNNFMNNDRLMMMQIQQQRYRVNGNCYDNGHNKPAEIHTDYQQMPLYSNHELMKAAPNLPIPPIPPIPTQHGYVLEPNHSGDYQNNYYANNEEMALHRCNNPVQLSSNQLNYHDFNISMPRNTMSHGLLDSNINDDFEYHIIDLDRERRDSNWGIRLIGGAEVNRAISIGSVVNGGVAAKNGQLKSGDEIMSINGKDVVGATHRHVVDLISACAERATLKIRRKKFAEACEVKLRRSLDEGFGFVIISITNCALIGKIIPGSPADRCQQLHVRDRIIAVNGREVTENMQHPDIVNMIKESGSELRLRIIPADCYTVELIKNSPSDNFGFSMRGGSEYDGTGLYILRVTPDGLARDLLNVGDQIIEINGIPTVGMTHMQAASIIKHSDPIVRLKLRRNYVTPPSLLVDSPRELCKFNQISAEVNSVPVTDQQGYVQHHNISSSSTSPEFNNKIDRQLVSHDNTNHFQRNSMNLSLDAVGPLTNQTRAPFYA